MRKLGLFALCVLIGVAAGYPMFWMVSTGLKSRAEFLESTWSIPRRPRYENYLLVWYGERTCQKCGKEFAGTRCPSCGWEPERQTEPFKRYYVNSIIVNAVSLVLIVLSSALAGYAFARMRFRWKEPLFYLFLAGMMVPVHITLIPLYRLTSALPIGYFVLILPYTAFSIPVSVFILRGFFEEIPVELEEAARLDGCSDLGVFLRVMLPLSKPALATVAIINFVNNWNEFVFATTFIRSPEMKTIPVGLMDFSDSFAGDPTLVCAALTLSVVPVMVCYVFLQRQIISGLTAGALKQ